jgi:hypothetical protein
MKDFDRKKIFFALGTVSFLLLAGCEHPLGYTRELAQPVYEVKTAPAVNGTIRALPAKGIAGTEITIAVNPNPGYRLKESSLYGYDGGAAEKGTSMSVPPYRFNLAKNITVFAEFEPVPEGHHTATVDENIQGGTIIPYGKTYDGDKIQIGPPNGRSTISKSIIIFLVIQPEPGFTLKEDSVKWDGIPLSAPFEFVLPSNRDVVITAEFESRDSDAFVKNGITALHRDDYDSAVRAFDEAYRMDPENKDAIFYSTLGRLASIAVDVNVRKLMTSLGVAKYPANLNNMFTNGDAWDNYYDSGSNQTFQRPSWLADYSGGIRLWNVSHTPQGYYAIQNQEFIWIDSYSASNSQQPTMATFYLAMFFNLMGTNVSSWNDVVDNTLMHVFGDAFETAASRSTELDYGGSVVLEQKTIEKLFLTDLFQDGDMAGRAELDTLFAFLRSIKAGLEWISAYDLNMDRSMFRFTDNIPRDGSLAGVIDMLNKKYVDSSELIGDFTDNNDVINKIISYVFRVMDERFIANDIHASNITAMLPLRNSFLLERPGALGRLSKSKADLIKAIDALSAAYDYYYDPARTIPQGIQDKLDKYRWAKDSLIQFKSALQSENVFYFPRKLPTSSDAWNYTEGNADYGIHMGKLYTPGQLSLDKLVSTESGGKKPKFFGWSGDTTLPGTYIKKQADFENHEWIGFELNLKSLKQVFVKGLEKDSRVLNDFEYVHTVFPDILLNPRNGKKLYEFYYDLYNYSVTLLEK